MSGDLDHNFPAFLDVEKRLRNMLDNKVIVHNPAHNFPGVPVASYEYADYFRADLHHLLQCQVIVFLPEWRKSLGAMLEWRVGCALDLAMFELPTNWFSLHDASRIGEKYIPNNHHRNDPVSLDYPT